MFLPFGGLTPTPWDIYKEISEAIFAPEPTAVSDSSYKFTYRGLFARSDNLEDVLKFQFNPEEITWNKDLKLTDREMLGQGFVKTFFSNGGANTASFSLLFDATAATQNRFYGVNSTMGTDTLEIVRPYDTSGVLAIKRYLTELRYPKPDAGQVVFNQNGQYVPAKKFNQIPTIIWVHGPLYLECVMSGLKIRDMLFNSALTPVRIMCDIELKILETRIIDSNISLRELSTNGL